MPDILVGTITKNNKIHYAFVSVANADYLTWVEIRYNLTARIGGSLHHVIADLQRRPDYRVVDGDYKDFLKIIKQEVSGTIKYAAIFIGTHWYVFDKTLTETYKYLPIPYLPDYFDARGYSQINPVDTIQRGDMLLNTRWTYSDEDTLFEVLEVLGIDEDEQRVHVITTVRASEQSFVFDHNRQDVKILLSGSASDTIRMLPGRFFYVYRQED